VPTPGVKSTPISPKPELIGTAYGNGQRIGPFGSPSE
jgi:hypothetical protein